MATLVLSEIFPPRVGGSGRWLHEIYSRQQNGQYIIATGDHEAGEAFDASSNLNIKRLPLTMSAWGLRSLGGLKGYASNFLKLRRICRDNDVDMIHCGRNLPEGWMAYLLRRFCGIPYVCFIHGEDVECAAESRELKWMTSKVLHNAELLIANSNFTGGRLKESWQVPDHQLKILHPGCDTKRFQPLPQNHHQSAEKNETVLLTVGRLQRRKGHDVMIQALPEIRKAVPDIRYNIVGGGEEKDGLARLAKETGVEECVHFYDEITDDELTLHYQTCDLFALPNRQIGGDVEGFGMVLVEAQACGRPVLAGASGGTADTLVQNETGQRVDCQDPKIPATTVIQMLSDRQRLNQMGMNGREFVTSTFDWEILAKNAEEVFANVK